MLVNSSQSTVRSAANRGVELHSAINEFLLDSRLADLAQNRIPDAAERLRYVISMTEQAATPP